MGREIKFYMDEHVAKAIVRGLRQRGVDVLTLADANMLGASDEEHVELAQREGRVIFTQDQDYLRLHSAGVSHAGIAYLTHEKSIGEIIRGLMLIYEISDADEMEGRVEYL